MGIGGRIPPLLEEKTCSPVGTKLASSHYLDRENLEEWARHEGTLIGANEVNHLPEILQHPALEFAL